MATDRSIKLSPALSKIIRRDHDRDYLLRWVDGFFRTYINKEDVLLKIRERFQLMLNSAYKKFPEKGDREETLKFKNQIKDLLDDLKDLSHSDFDILSQVNFYESLERPMKKINKKKIILTKEA